MRSSPVPTSRESTFAPSSLLLLVVLVAWGCQRPVQVDPEPVRIGVVAEEAYESAVRAAVTVASRHLRAAGGVLNGRPVEFDVRIIGLEVADVELPVQELAEELQVPVLVGPIFGPAAAFLAQQITYEARVVQIVPFIASETRLYEVQPNDDRYLYFLSPPLSGGAFAGFSRALLDAGCLSLGVVSVTLGVEGVTREFGPTYATREGTEIVGYPANAVGIYSDRAYVESVRAGGHDCVALYGPAEGNSAFVRAWYAEPGAQPIRFIGGANLTLADFIDNIGAPSNIEGALALSGSTPDVTRPEYDALRREVEATLGPTSESDMGFISGVYDSIIMAAYAVEAARTDRPGPAVRDALLSISRSGGALEASVGPTEVLRALRLINQGTPVNYEGALSNSDINDRGFVDRRYSLLTYGVERGWTFVSTL